MSWKFINRRKIQNVLYTSNIYIYIYVYFLTQQNAIRFLFFTDKVRAFQDPRVCISV